MATQKISSITEREKLKDELVNEREKGEFQKAIDGFKEIVEWDERNENFSGAIDALGHLTISLVNFAKEKTEEIDKEELFKKAGESINKAKDLIVAHLPTDTGIRSIVNAHNIDLIIEEAKNLSSPNKQDKIKQAIDIANTTIQNLAGSKAHLAWVYNKKAQLQQIMNQYDDALKTLGDAEIAIFEGYEDELENNDGEMKLQIWLTGLWLTKASIYKETKKDILANLYIDAITNLPDKKEYLRTRKSQAERLK